MYLVANVDLWSLYDEKLVDTVALELTEETLLEFEHYRKLAVAEYTRSPRFGSIEVLTDKALWLEHAWQMVPAENFADVVDEIPGELLQKWEIGESPVTGSRIYFNEVSLCIQGYMNNADVQVTSVEVPYLYLRELIKKWAYSGADQ